MKEMSIAVDGTCKRLMLFPLFPTIDLHIFFFQVKTVHLFSFVRKLNCLHEDTEER